jgi:ADP-heptose:LPS heptosyltransferase
MPNYYQNFLDKHLLVLHIAGLGQTVLALPALRALRQHLPEARLTIAASTVGAEVIRLAHCADEVLPVGRLRGAEVLNPRSAYRSSKALGEIKRGIYDLAVELHSGTEASLLLQLAQPRERLERRRNALQHGISVVIERATQRLRQASGQPSHLTHDAHRYLQKLEPLGVRPVEAEPRLVTDREADARLEKLLTKHGVQSGELLVGLHPGASNQKPRWEYARFVSLATRLHHNFNARLLVFAGKNERGLARRMLKDLPAKSAIALENAKLPDVVSAMARLSLFVGNHSGPAHLAAAAGAPVVVISPHPAPTAQDVLSSRQFHLRASHVSLINEEDVYEAACQLLKANRATILSAR